MSILTEKVTWQRERREEVRAKVRNKLTADEQKNVRRAVEYLRVVYRSRSALARAMKMNYDTLRKAASPGRRQSMRLAVAAAYVARVQVEMILMGQWPKRNACPWCGR